jgi:hypothetical protein
MAYHQTFRRQRIHAEDMSHKRKIRIRIMDVSDRDQGAENRQPGGHQDFCPRSIIISFAPILLHQSQPPDRNPSVVGKPKVSPDRESSGCRRKMSRPCSCPTIVMPPLTTAGVQMGRMSATSPKVISHALNAWSPALQARCDGRLVGFGVGENGRRRRGRRQEVQSNRVCLYGAPRRATRTGVRVRRAHFVSGG